MIDARIGVKDEFCNFVRRGRWWQRTKGGGIDSFSPCRNRRMWITFETNSKIFCRYRRNWDGMFRRPAATQADDVAIVLSIIAGFQSLLWNTHVRNELLNEVGVLGHITDGSIRMFGRIFKLDPGLCALGGNR